MIGPLGDAHRVDEGPVRAPSQYLLPPWETALSRPDLLASNHSHPMLTPSLTAARCDVARNGSGRTSPEIFGTSAEDLRRQGINPRQYATEHRDEVRQFVQRQRRAVIAVPGRRASGARGSEDGAARGPLRYGTLWGGQRWGPGVRGGSAWIGVLLALLALRFLLVDSYAGTHVAVFWVLGIGGIMLVARVVLFSWLRRRRSSGRRSGGPPHDASRW